MVDLETALDDCLGDELTLEECLKRYPEHAEKLRRLLAAATQLKRSRAVRPSASFKLRNRAQLLAHIHQNPHARRPRPLISPGLLLMMALLVLALAFLAVSIGAAQASLPGDGMYDWKRASERVWRAISPDRLTTDLALVQRRVDELRQVAGNARTEPLAREEYHQALSGLNQYTDPESRELIAESLTEQKDELSRAGVMMPELDQLIVVMRATVDPPWIASPTSALEMMPLPFTSEPIVDVMTETPLPLPADINPPEPTPSLPTIEPTLPLPTFSVPPTTDDRVLPRVAELDETAVHTPAEWIETAAPSPTELAEGEPGETVTHTPAMPPDSDPQLWRIIG